MPDLSETYKNTTLSMRVKESLYKKQSQYQLIEIADTHDWGRVLMLDGCMMASEADEHFYHETIVHLPMALLENVETVLVLGGGDGGTVRELTKYQQIKTIDMVEIDGEVIDACKQYLPQTASGYDDSRVRVYIEDANNYLESTNKLYDLIICDGSDPVGFAEVLIQEEFYQTVQSKLNPRGLFITQSGSPLQQPDELGQTKTNLAKVFPHTQSYWSLVPIYPGAYWSFTIGAGIEIPRDKKNTEIISQTKFWKDTLIQALEL